MHAVQLQRLMKESLTLNRPPERIMIRIARVLADAPTAPPAFKLIGPGLG
jgi:hypothetical protein